MTTRRPSGELLYKGPNSTVTRAFCDELNVFVVKKTHNDEFPTMRERNKYAKEVRMGQKLAHDEYIIKYRGKEGLGKDETIIMEDFNAISIEMAVHQHGPFSIDEFLRVALKIVDAVSWVHQHKLFHGSLCSSHILWNKENNIIKLVDFGLCSDLMKDNVGLAQQLSAGSGYFAYKSPEQTGRMNREVDYRTDLYSLGVIFYYMLTGKLPFDESFPLDLIYSIIARAPAPPSHYGVPTQISDIIMHLLEKNVENRYQSTYGIRIDLKQFVQDANCFSVGKYDLCSTLHISQKLYGRTNELNILLTAFEKVAAGHVQSMLVLVAGYSGVGKTALINEVHKPLVRQHGYFISGKFDQLKRSSIPYSSFISAFQQLITTLLTETSDSIQYWRKRLLDALGNRGQILIDVIPDIQHIIGPQPQVPELGPEENANRFKAVFQSFVSVFAQKDHPLIIFLDDLQWADLATLSFIELLLTSSTTQYLLIFGAYRDNEVGSSHPLVDSVRRIERMGCAMDTISLKPLGLDNIQTLIGDSLHITTQSEDIKQLASIVYRKTGGNPFFMIMYLKNLAEDDLIMFDFDQGCWKFDIYEIELKTQTTENVVEMMTSRLQKLGENTQVALSLGACLGNQFDYELLEMVYNTIEGKEGGECAEALWPVIREGLIIQMGQKPHENKWLNREDLDATLIGKNTLQFLHDRVQQAAYELVDQERQDLIHVSIGRLLLRNLSQEEIDEKLFDIISHFRIARNVLKENPEECTTLAQLNLKAARKAKFSSANFLGVEFAQFGLDLLIAAHGEEALWQKEETYPVTIALYKELCQCLYLCERFTEAENLYPYVERCARNDMDEIDVKSIRAKQYEVQQRYHETVAILSSSLRMLGIHLPYGNNEEATRSLQHELSEISVNLRGRNISDIIYAEEMTDKRYIMAMQLLNTAHAPSFVIGELVVYSLIAATMVNLSLKYGNCDVSAVGYGYYGLCSAEYTNDYLSAYRFAKMAVELADRTASVWKGRVLLYLAVGPACFYNNYATILETFKAAVEKSIEYSDLAIAGYCQSYMPFTHGLYDEMNNVFLTHQSCLNYLEKNNPYFYQVAKLPAVWLEYLWTPEASSNLVSTLVRHHSPVVPPDRNSSMLVATYELGRLMTAYYKHDTKNWLEYADMCDITLMRGVKHLIYVPIAYFFIALVYLYNDYTGHEDLKESRLKRANTIIEQYELWAQLNPENFKHRLLILHAQRHSCEGRYIAAAQSFEVAAKTASDYGLPLIQAMALELAGEMWSSIGLCKHEFRDCIARSHYLYNTAGAIGKVDAFKHKYGPQHLPELEMPMPRVLLALGEFLSRSRATERKTTPEEPFDIMAVMMASKAISSEMTLEQFLYRMMRIILQYAGASRGVYIQAMEGLDQEEMTVVAEGSVDNMQVDAMRIVPLQDYDNVPRGLVYYVMRVKEPVVIGLSSNIQFFKELNGNVRSALCFPVIRNSECKGVLYLENNIVEDAFSVKHAEIMSILTNQVSMALENAKLAGLLESERRFKTTALQLEQAKKRLEEFIDILCHELRNPLNVICGNNEILNELVVKLRHLEGSNFIEKLSEYIAEFNESLTTTSSAADQLKDIIDTVLTVSMLENKSVRLQSVSFEPSQVIERVASMFMEKASEKRLTLEHEIRLSERSMKVIGDPHRLQEVLVNLVSNAIKFTGQPGGRVSIRCSEEGIDNHRVTLYFSVEDTGCGLSDKDVGRILSSNSTSFRLGLRISKELCELMGGSLVVGSKLGEGTIFSFSLSFDIEESTAHEHPGTPQGAHNTIKRVLVVDDSVINQKILCRLLRNRGGYHCDVASNGVEAVQVLGVAQYDIVLMDVEMPIMNGLEATKRVREMEAERKVIRPLPIIGVSGNPRDEILPIALAAGMQAYVTKPYMATEIFSTVERLLM